MEQRIAYMILNSLPGIGPGRVHQLELCLGGPEAILQASAVELQRAAGIGGHLADVIIGWRRHCDPDRELKLAGEAGAYVVTLADESYPALLREIHDPPLCLYVRGSLDCLKDDSGTIAIVGSRHPSPYGVRMTRQLAGEAARNGWTTVSGLANGIDTCAHEASLQAGGPTIAVLGSGLCHLYPQNNMALATAICGGHGAVITEFPMLMRPDRRNFPMRNRIISGLSRGAIIVEAGLQSGSLITAAQAIEQGRTVFAVPGLADQPFAKGCHALIKDGARLVENFRDVLDEFTLLPEARAQSRLRQQEKRNRENPPPPPPPVKVNDLEYRIWEALADGECELEALLANLQEVPSTVLPLLLVMEMKGLVRQLPGRRLRRDDRKNVQKFAD